MVTTDTRPVLIFGKTEEGDYDLVHADANVPEQALRLFVRFAKAVNWRPKKLDATTYVATGVLPCGEHVIVCRLLEDSKDADPQKRPLIMRVEGVVCPAGDIRWQQWLNPATWPTTRLSPPFGPLKAELPGGVSEHSVNLELVYGKPFLLEPRSDLLTYPTHCMLQQPAPGGAMAPGAPRVRDETSKEIALSPSQPSQSQSKQVMKRIFVAMLALLIGLAAGVVITLISNSNQKTDMSAQISQLKNDNDSKKREIERLQAEVDVAKSRFESEVEKTREAIKPVEKKLSDIINALSVLDKKVESFQKGQNSAGQRIGGSRSDLKPKAFNPSDP